jgi:hypothetical protein
MSGEPDNANPHARRMKEVFDFESHPGIALVRPEIAKQLVAACKPPAPCAALLAVHQIDEDRWQSMVVVEHQTIGFGPLCESEEECQWYCSQFKVAMGKAGARFISPNSEIDDGEEGA